MSLFNLKEDFSNVEECLKAHSFYESGFKESMVLLLRFAIKDLYVNENKNASALKRLKVAKEGSINNYLNWINESTSVSFIFSKKSVSDDTKILISFSGEEKHSCTPGGRIEMNVTDDVFKDFLKKLLFGLSIYPLDKNLERSVTDMVIERLEEYEGCPYFTFMFSRDELVIVELVDRLLYVNTNRTRTHLPLLKKDLIGL